MQDRGVEGLLSEKALLSEWLQLQILKPQMLFCVCILQA